MFEVYLKRAVYFESSERTKWDAIVEKGSHFHLKRLELILKKCLNIETIEISDNLFDAKNWGKAITLINYYCHHLVSINCRFDVLRKRVFNQFVKNLGNKLKFYTIVSNKEQKFFKSFSNIKIFDI